MLRKLHCCWQAVRRLSGDDAYERYLKHYTEHQQHHCIHSTEMPLSKKAFFKRWQDDKWNGINRCC